MKIKNQKDFWSGALLIGLGVVVIGASQQYHIGTAAAMGPAYFPIIMGVITALLGVILCVQGMSSKATEEKVEGFAWSILLFILGPIVLFGLLLDTLGLVLSLLMLVVTSSIASREFSLKVALISAAALTALSLTVFVWALSLQFNLWPAFLRE